MIEIYKNLVPEKSGLEYECKAVSSQEFYGKGYDDSDIRIPDIDKARKLLGWEPTTTLADALRVTMASYIKEYGAEGAVEKAV
jgi:UDP-apiose/xylose synthase